MIAVNAVVAARGAKMETEFGMFVLVLLLIGLGFVGLYIAARLISHAYFKSRQFFEEKSNGKR
jgi:hypothetical protein